MFTTVPLAFSLVINSFLFYIINIDWLPLFFSNFDRSVDNICPQMILIPIFLPSGFKKFCCEFFQLALNLQHQSRHFCCIFLQKLVLYLLQFI